MEKQEFLDQTSLLKKEKQSLLNDTFLWVSLARESVQNLPDTKFAFEVPKAGKPNQTRTVQRNHAQTVKNRMLSKDIFNSAFIAMVAAIEDYLSKIMVSILLYDNRRIMCTVAGVNFNKEISVVDLITKDRSDLISQIIQERVNTLFYASPQKQLEYFDKALGIKVEDDIWGKWIEIKARRDLWVHNAGIANQIYLDKVKDYSLVLLGKEALIDQKYFSDSVATMKTLVGRIDRDIRNAYKNTELKD